MGSSPATLSGTSRATPSRTATTRTDVTGRRAVTPSFFRVPAGGKVGRRVDVRDRVRRRDGAPFLRAGHHHRQLRQQRPDRTLAAGEQVGGNSPRRRRVTGT